MTHRRPKVREVKFCVEDDRLIRVVNLPNGRVYRHACPRSAFEAVAYAVDATTQGQGLTLERLAVSLDLAFTQVNVALEFLKERGIILTRGRRGYPASDVSFEDAMVEYHALREKGGCGD